MSMTLAHAPDDDARIVKGLGDFCANFCRGAAGDALPCIIRGYVNRVSKPATPDYVLITPLTLTRTGTNLHAWDASTGTQSVTQPARRRVQIDCCGGMAPVWAKTVATLLRDMIGVDFLAPYGLTPLWCDDPRDLTQAGGDEQYHPRLSVDAHLQVNDIVGVDLDFFTNVNLILRPQA